MWPGRGSGLQWSTETSMRVGEDGRKVREVPEQDAQLVGGTARCPRHVCGLHQHGWGTMDNRKPEPVWLPWKKASMVWGAAPRPGIVSISITCPFLSEGAQQRGQAPNAAVAQAAKL